MQYIVLLRRLSILDLYNILEVNDSIIMSCVKGTCDFKTCGLQMPISAYASPQRDLSSFVVLVQNHRKM